MQDNYYVALKTELLYNNTSLLMTTNRSKFYQKTSNVRKND